MSNIIKSFRVVEIEKSDKNFSEEMDIKNKFSGIEEELKNKLLIAEKEAIRIIEEAESKADEKILAMDNEVKKMKEKAESDLLAIKEKSKNIAYDEGFTQGKSEGYDEGYSKGYSEGKDHSQLLIEDAIKIKNKMIDEKNRTLNALEGEIIDLIIDINKKVLGNIVESTEEYIVELVAAGIKNLDPTDKLTIITSKKDFNILKEHRDRILAEASLINELELKYDINFSKGDCILETSKGSIDLSLNDQLKEVERLLNNILNNE